MGILTDPIVNAMNELSERMKDSTKSINNSMNDLGKTMTKFSESSNSLQEKLVFWTKIMAGAIIVQIIALVVITFFRN